MYRQIKSSLNPTDFLTYKEKEHLAENLFNVVSRYFRNDGYGRPHPVISFSQYDILGYTFRINSQTLNQNAEYAASTGYDAPDLNAFKKEVRNVLKAYGFDRVKFDIRTVKAGYEWYGELKYDSLKMLIAIYFDTKEVMN